MKCYSVLRLSQADLLCVCGERLMTLNSGRVFVEKKLIYSDENVFEAVLLGFDKSIHVLFVVPGMGM